MLLLLLACASVLPPLPSWDSSGGPALIYEQIDCDGWLGQAGLIVGPDGTAVLWDVGNDGHAEVVHEAIARRTGGQRVDWTVVTHFHGDHGGGLDALAERGVDLGQVVVRDRVPLAASSADVVDALEARFPEREALCAEGVCALPRILPLGEGATLSLVAANGQVLDAPYAGDLPDSHAGENARSVVGILRWGEFWMVLPGDLSGGGKGTPDLESPIAAAVAPPEGADVLLLGHHGIDSSTNQAWIDAWLPDAAGRYALVGANGGYLDSPGGEVMDRLDGRVETVWVTRAGLLSPRAPGMTEARGAVAVQVTDGGGAFQIGAVGR